MTITWNKDLKGYKMDDSHRGRVKVRTIAIKRVSDF